MSTDPAMAKGDFRSVLRRKTPAEVKAKLLEEMRKGGISPKHIEAYKKRKAVYKAPPNVTTVKERTVTDRDADTSGHATGGVKAGLVADISAVQFVYRADNRSPEDMAKKFPGFTAMVNQNPASMTKLLKEMLNVNPNGLDDWMANWVAGNMMGEVPCVSTTTDSSGHGVQKKYMYKIAFPGGLQRKDFTEEVLGFPPKPPKTPQTTGLYMNGNTTADSDTVVLAYSKEILFLTRIPEEWIKQSRPINSQNWQNYPPPS
jgi:hypothetical protein